MLLPLAFTLNAITLGAILYCYCSTVRAAARCRSCRKYRCAARIARWRGEDR